MICPNCKQTIDDNARFCTKCGSVIPKCPTCGRVLTERVRFCTNDGTPIPDEILELIPENNNSKIENKSNFCTNCGRPCNYGEDLCQNCKSIVNQQASQKGSFDLKTVLPIVIIVVLVLAAAVFFAIKSNIISVSFNSGGNNTEVSEDIVLNEDFSDEESVDKEETTGETTEAKTETTTKEQQKVAVINPAADTPIRSFNKAIASSQLANQGSYSYYPSNVVDGNIRTAWVEGVSGTGEGEWIQIQSDYVETIHKVGIVNGYRQDNSTYEKNGRVYRAELSFSDGTSQVVYFDTVDNDGYTYFNVGTKETSYVRITLLSCYAGSKYEDTCISEVVIY